MRRDDLHCRLGDLFAKMANRGGLFGAERIDWFNSGLCADSGSTSMRADGADARPRSLTVLYFSQYADAGPSRAVCLWFSRGRHGFDGAQV